MRVRGVGGEGGVREEEIKRRRGGRGGFRRAIQNYIFAIMIVSVQKVLHKVVTRGFFAGGATGACWGIEECR